MQSRKKVYIQHKSTTYFVLYLDYIDHKPNCNHCAAQFNVIDTEVTEVINWIEANP